MDRRRSGVTWIDRDAARVARAFAEFFAGYGQDPDLNEKTFEEIEGYDEMIVLRASALKAIASITWRR